MESSDVAEAASPLAIEDEITQAPGLGSGVRFGSLVAEEGKCSECLEMDAEYSCLQCKDSFCEICCKGQHRKGKRQSHTITRTAVAAPTKMSDVEIPSFGSAAGGSDAKENGSDEESDASTPLAAGAQGPLTPAQAREADLRQAKNLEYDHSHAESYSAVYELTAEEKALRRDRYYQYQPRCVGKTPIGEWWCGKPPMTWWLDRAKYVPVRLLLPERKLMRLVKAVMSVSEYTDRVDQPGLGKAKRMHTQLRELMAVLNGVALSKSYDVGQKLLSKEYEFKTYADFFFKIFELARRHKIRNPEKLRSIYGKLVYLLQDSMSNELQQMLEFTVVTPVKTAFTELEAGGCLRALGDDLMCLATGEIMPDGRERPEIDRCIKFKEAALAKISQKYATKTKSAEDLKQVLLAFGDNHSYLRYNRDPCDRMIKYLKDNFDPANPGDHSLSINEGADGARLTHDHAMQYHFALQSLTLWREILHDMYRLWSLAEDDLLDPTNPYKLQQTGQGLQRVQAAPRVSKAMRAILYRTQQQLGHWVGSSVIHLGDANVPNALYFIDKYNSVGRILNPIVSCLRVIGTMYGDAKQPQVKQYVDSAFGSLHDCRMAILTDFFRSAFDGSGADNFYAAGSCIDGRLTSAWNWCQQLASKPFYHVFLLTGFSSFDGKEFAE